MHPIRSVLGPYELGQAFEIVAIGLALLRMEHDIRRGNRDANVRVSQHPGRPFPSKVLAEDRGISFANAACMSSPRELALLLARSRSPARSFRQRWEHRLPLARWISFAGAITLWLTACSDPDGIPIQIAVGATVTLQLGAPWCGADPDEPCLSKDISSVESIELKRARGALEVEGFEEKLNGPQVRITAHRAGNAILVVKYRDRHDELHEDQFSMRATEIDRVDASVLCDGPIGANVPYAVPSGARFTVFLEAEADGLPLLTGSLPLITDADGFILEGRHAIAPERPGSYTWSLAGRDSMPRSFRVFSPEDVSLTLERTVPALFLPSVAEVSVTATLDDTSICLLDSAMHARARVQEGSCTPVINGVAFQGDIPLDIRGKGSQLFLTGSGDCTLEVAHTGAAPVTLTVPLGEGPDQPPPPRGGLVPLTEEPVPRTLNGGDLETCDPPEVLPSDNCEVRDVLGLPIPNADCFRDWRWKLTHVDGTAERRNLPSGFVGVGLNTELLATIEKRVITIETDAYPPAALELSAGSGVQAEFLGCASRTEASIGLRATSPGTHKLTLATAIFEEKGTAEIRAQEVARVVFETAARDIVMGEANDLVHVFVGSHSPLHIRYESADGTPLGGHAEIYGSTNDAGALAEINNDGTELYTGVHAHQILLTSPLSPRPFVIDVVEEHDIAAIGASEDVILRTGSTSHCVPLVPRAADGYGISGTAPVLPVVTLQGQGVVVTGRWSDTQLCLRGMFPGEGTVEAAWGSAKASWTWVVE